MFEQNPTLGPGTSSFTSHLFEILIMLLIAALLGYLLGRLLANNKWKSVVANLNDQLNSANKRIHDLEVDYRQQNHRVTILEEELKECGNQKIFLQEDIEIWRNKSHQFEDENKELIKRVSSFSVGGIEKEEIPTKSIEEKRPFQQDKNDDLARIEGIGPVIRDLLYSKGITTFEQLGKTDQSILEDYLTSLESGRLHDSSSWAKQARLAAANNMEALDDYQAYLVAGRDPALHAGLDDSREYFGTKVKLNDLELIEGIGPKIEELFNAHGIYTWAKLAGTSVERCREILGFGGSHYAMHDPSTWPRQAALAAGLQWKELKEYQDVLNAGRT